MLTFSVPTTIPPTERPHPHFLSTTQDILMALDDEPMLPPAEISPKCEAFVIGQPTKNTFYSPNYPDLYTNNTDCVKIIDAPPGYYLKLDFRDRFDIEPSQDCRFDSLEIRDGPNGYDKLIGEFCGSVFPPIIYSSGRSLWLRFTSDENIESRGFKGVYEYIKRSTGTEVPEKLCRKVLTGMEGFVNRSDIDQEFIDRSTEFSLPMECMWTIQVDPGWRIQLQFNKFALEVPNDCESNFVDVFPEATDIPSRLYNFCGSIAEMVQSPKNILKIRFLALPRGMKSNFEALYTAFRDKPKSSGCEEGEYDCEDATCISETLKCNGRINCRFRSDEDPSRCMAKEGVLDTILNTEHMIIILVVFFLILTGMCFAFLFNCFRKLIRDHRTIQEHMRRSREARLHEDGASKQVPAIFNKRECYVPSTESLSMGDQMSKPESSGPEVEMRDSIAQTHESVFTRSSEADDELLAPITRVDFSTFGLGVRRNDEPRALSMDSTKSAPDVILTWNHRSTPL
ncbi:CUB domain [Nesidiocoris tenuis]|uniref:CUB domain n=1 Tax=Nesidiocoris tenuis TaxID=355587 RepID=A0ABN7B8Y0_9HEMI|nr:CUB domain [Nesidiocoris tenuis]